MTFEKTQLSNYHNLIARILSALVAVTIVGSTLYYFKLSGALTLILIVSALIAFEISNLFFSGDNYLKFVIPALTTVSLFFSLQNTHKDFLNSFNILENGTNYALLPIYIGLIALPWIYRLKPAHEIFDKFAIYLLIAFYCYFLPLKIFDIFSLDTNFYYFCLFALLVFGTDTLAYFFGKIFGRKFFKNSFQPQISPSKTIEGFIGSLLWPLILISVCQQLEIFEFSILSIGYLYLTALAAISGDLLASLIKRKSMKKDSGSLFIGHGGFLDRLDSLLLSAPIFLMAAPYVILYVQ